MWMTIVSMGIWVSYKLKHYSYFRLTVKVRWCDECEGKQTEKDSSMYE